MDVVHNSEQAALATLCLKKPEIIPPPEIEKFHLRLGNKFDLKILTTLKFNLQNSGKNALILSLMNFSVMHLTQDPSNSSDARFIVQERSICRDDLAYLKGHKEKDFDPKKIDNYAVFVLLKIRNPIMMFGSMYIEFWPAGGRAFFKKQYK